MLRDKVFKRMNSIACLKRPLAKLREVTGCIVIRDNQFENTILLFEIF